MIAPYERPDVSDDELQRLDRAFEDLLVLARCPVPAVRAAARGALAHVAQARNGLLVGYELYTAEFDD